MKIIDTHVHIWDLEKAQYPWLQGDNSILNRTWRIEEIENDRKEAGVIAGVLVQASGNMEDTELMLETAYKTDWICGIVGWLPLKDTKATQRLLEERFLKEKYFKGVRHQIHDEKDPKWLMQPAVLESLEILATYKIPYDVVGVLPVHIETAISVANKIPGLRMVFDHLNQPPISTNERFGKWGQLISVAANHKNFYAKISGLGTASGNFSGWKTEHLAPYVDWVVDHFGIDRCFCGGDWPVSQLSGSYGRIWDAYQEIIFNRFTQSDADKIFYENAKQFYNLEI
jgi:L-fuconolactonase